MLLCDWLRAVLDLWTFLCGNNTKQPLLHHAPTFSHCGEISRTVGLTSKRADFFLLLNYSCSTVQRFALDFQNGALITHRLLHHLQHLSD